MARGKTAMELKRKSVLSLRTKFPDITIKQLALQHGVTTSAVKKWLAKADAIAKKKEAVNARKPKTN